ncbi:MAG: hypothetical protein ACK4FB_09540 [Brevundimonas sp.]|uniref:hypothetical protein n=1 Tax=Brevundimonas sp. TaxID=1871086 RepID=UPI003919C6A0
MRTITRLFDHYSDGLDAIRSLENDGYDSHNISLISNNTEEWHAADGSTDAAKHHDDHDHGNKAGEGAATGAGVGAALGGGAGLLAGLGMLAIPGVGPVVAAGWLAATAAGAIGGAVAGGATGGLVGALTKDGESEEDAHVYAEGVRRGGSLVSVRVSDDRANDVEAVLERHGGVIAEKRGSAYRSEGWERFDESAEPYDRDRVMAERARYRTEAVAQEPRSFTGTDTQRDDSISDDRIRAEQSRTGDIPPSRI